VQPFAAGITRFDDAMADSAELPAERLHAAGFRTAGFYRNAWVAPNFGFGQGFDFYLFPTPNLTEDRLQQNSPSVSSLQGSDYDATEVALEFLQGHGHERFFLYLHLMDVHQYQYEEESALFGTTYSDAYDNAIHWTDRNIGLLVAELIERDLFDKTILVIASDHGEEFQEHGGEGHARTLYVETTRTPLLVSLPFAIDGGLVVEEWVENADIFPTIFDMLGLEPLALSEGRSLVPLIEAAGRGEGNGPVADRPVMSQLDRTWGRSNEAQPLVSVTRGAERLIFDPEDPEKVQLYDLAADPGEQNNLAAERPDRVAALLAEGRERFARRTEGAIAESVEVDELQLQQLRALGYVVEGK
jgi:arylsulfatase A-like enzyme